jgi:hypothetical protein
VGARARASEDAFRFQSIFFCFLKKQLKLLETRNKNDERTFGFEFRISNFKGYYLCEMGVYYGRSVLYCTRSLEKVGADARLDAPERVEIRLNDWSENHHRRTHEGDGNDERKPQSAGGKPKG